MCVYRLFGVPFVRVKEVCLSQTFIISEIHYDLGTDVSPSEVTQVC